MRRRSFLGAAGSAALTTPLSRAAPGYGSMLWDHIIGAIRHRDERRAKRLQAVKTPSQLKALQTRVRASLLEMWGGLPSDRTPLNPTNAGTLDRGDHVVEKIIFESRPSFYVTANLYRPKAALGRLPAIVFPPGHGDAGKAYESYQRFCILMARNNFVVLALDCIGQGERLQLWDPKKRSSPVRPGTGEHTVLGRQCYLLGINLMQYRVWDTIRGLDYLSSRDDVDPERIGLAGQSGGGMEALQLAPFETRFRAAASVCAVATFRHKTEALLMADPEQILSGTLERGIDHPELVATVAPRPMLIGSALRDYVPIAAARRTYSEAQPIFELVDAGQKLGMVETDDTHGLNLEFRRDLCKWFLRWLGDGRPFIPEQPAELPSERELWCTRSGQVSEDLAGDTVLTLNRQLRDRMAPDRRVPRTLRELSAYRREIRNLAQQVTRVRVERDEAGIAVPSQTFGTSGSAVLLIAEAGKDAPAVQSGIVQPLVAAGHRIAAVDVRGWGETKPNMPGRNAHFAWDDFFAYRSVELGEPMFGQRLRDVLTAAPKLLPNAAWTAIGIGAGALLLAHAAVLDPRFSRIVLVRPLLSYRSLVDDPLYLHPFSSFLPGVIGAYDVVDLLAAISPRKLLVINPEDARRVRVRQTEAQKEFERASKVHQLAPGRLDLGCELTAGDIPNEIAAWLKIEDE